MNVIVLDHHPLADGRIERHLKLMLEKGHNVFRINLNRKDDRLEEGGFSMHGEQGYSFDIRKRGGTLRRYLGYEMALLSSRLPGRALEVLRDLGLDGDDVVLHVHDPGLLPLGRSLKRRLGPGARMVYDRHEHFEKGPRVIGLPASIWGVRHEVLARRSLDALVVVSEDMASRQAPKYRGIPVCVVNNFPEAAGYDFDAIGRKVSSFDPSNDLLVSYFGSINHRYDRDLELMLRTIRHLLDTWPKARALIGGRDANEEALSMLHDFEAEYPDRFHFLGTVPREQVMRVTQDTHVGLQLINPGPETWFVASSNKLYEYLICGVVPIIRANVENADDIRDAVVWLGRDEGIEVIKERLDPLISEPERLRRKMAMAAQIGRSYTWESIRSRYLDLYAQIMG